VSCHAEFVRYVHWHLMSIRVVEMLDIPGMLASWPDGGCLDDALWGSLLNLSYLISNSVGIVPD
jgi:hypothetical protein